MVQKNGDKGGRREEADLKRDEAHLEAMYLRTKPEINKWLHLTPRVAALGANATERGPVMSKRFMPTWWRSWF